MHYLILFIITTVMSSGYLVSIGIAPGPVKFLPDMMSGVVAAYVAIAGIKTRFALVRTAYWVVFTIALINIVFGIIANSVGTGPIIAGARYCLRGIPFFFLPAVYPFRESQIKTQLGLLTGFCLLQLPIAAYQRYDQLRTGHFTGDNVFGTLMGSGALTLFCIAAMCVLLALTMRRHISKTAFVAMFLIFLIPTTINETKITIFFIPIGILVTMWLGTAPGKRLRVLGTSVVLIAIAGAIFIPVYDYLGKQNVRTKDAYSIMDIFDKDFLEKYLDQGTVVGGKQEKDIGRVDAFTVPVSFISNDPVWFAFGVGLGNAAISSLGSQFSGYHSALLGRYATGGSSAGAVVLEMGMLGFLCVLTLHWLIFRDSIYVARKSNDLSGAVATGWPAVVILVTLSLFYAAIIPTEAISYLFWHFSGVLAAKRSQLALVQGPVLRRALSNSQMAS